MSGFLSRPVVAACILKGREVLMARRDAPGKEMIHHKWEFPGGKIESLKETPREAVYREILEELSLPVMVRDLLHVSINSYDHSDYPATVLFYLCLSNPYTVVNVTEGSGIDEWKWLTYHEISGMYLSNDLLPGAFRTAVILKEKGLLDYERAYCLCHEIRIADDGKCSQCGLPYHEK